MKALTPICLLLIMILSTFSSCREKKSANSNRVVVVQPFSDLDPALTKSLYRQLLLVFPNAVLRESIDLPGKAYYPLRNRYRADTLIRYLAEAGSSDTVVIGLTSKDISTAKGDNKDWGVMGLGYCPGKACVVSTFRLFKQNLPEQFYKVAIHELGHTQGLPHCSNEACFMRDAGGGNPLNDEKDFCSLCRSFLQKNGWVLN